MKRGWSRNVLNNFEKASSAYKKEASMQRIFAMRLAIECSKHQIPKGIWADLGSGTGLLAEALETFNPHQAVVRVDWSKGMLSQNHPDSSSKLWDLNMGLPTWQERPTLLASSFALHWLTDPTTKLREWFQALAPGGWLALAIPINGSFPEWQTASNNSGIPYTALKLPSEKSLLNTLDPSNIKLNEIHTFIQIEKSVTSLLKPIIKTGAHTSTKKELQIGELRSLLKSWPSSTEPKKVQLSWLVQILLVQK